MCAQSSSEKDQKMFNIGVNGVLDNSNESELFGVDFKLIDVRTDSVVKSGEASRQWEV